MPLAAHCPFWCGVPDVWIWIPLRWKLYFVKKSYCGSSTLVFPLQIYWLACRSARRWRWLDLSFNTLPHTFTSALTQPAQHEVHHFCFPAVCKNESLLGKEPRVPRPTLAEPSTALLQSHSLSLARGLGAVTARLLPAAHAHETSGTLPDCWDLIIPGGCDKTRISSLHAPSKQVKWSATAVINETTIPAKSNVIIEHLCSTTHKLLSRTG